MVPLEMDSLNNEAAIQVSVTWNPAILSNPVVALGPGAPPGSALTINPGQVSSGRIGILVDSAFTFTQSPPARQFVTITFDIAAGAPLGPTLIAFGDQPIPRSVSDAFGNTLVAQYVDGNVTVGTGAAGFEGDVTPRANPDGVVLSTDVTQLRRFATALDTLNPAVNEGQRADCAPRATFGDNFVTSGDVVQARRYATGLDPLTPAAGPLVTSFVMENVFGLFEDVYAYLFGREIRVGSVKANSESQVTVPVEMVAYGDEAAMSFTIEYDAGKLSNPKVQLADGAPAQSVLTVNSDEEGRIGILVDSTETMTASAVAKRVVMVTFDVSPKASGGTAISLTGSLAPQSLADQDGNTLAARYVDGGIAVSSR